MAGSIIHRQSQWQLPGLSHMKNFLSMPGTGHELHLRNTDAEIACNELAGLLIGCIISRGRCEPKLQTARHDAGKAERHGQAVMNDQHNTCHCYRQNQDGFQ